MQEVIRGASRGSGADEGQEPSGPGPQKLLVAGGILAALGATSCCILPLVLFGMGVTGAWMGNLTALSAYQPLFISAALVFIVFGFWRVYRRPAVACADGTACATPRSMRMTKFGLWTASVLIAAALAFPYLAPLFL